MPHAQPPHDIYRVVAVCTEYKELLKAKKLEPKRRREYGLKQLAEKFKVTPKTVKRWSELYARDIHLFNAGTVKLLSKLASKEDKLEQLAMKYKRLRQSKPSVSAEGRLVEQIDFLNIELKMFRDLYNEARQQLEVLRHSAETNRSKLSKYKREVERLRVELRRRSPHIEDTSLDVYGAARSSL
jgi:chromosome segregation ATPase